MSPLTDAHLARFYDAELFTAPFFTIDAENRLQGGMLKERPVDPAAVVVGTIRDDAVAIDIDLGEPGSTEWLLHHLVQWCEDHVTWYLHRASGGGEGRAHFFALPSEHVANDLRALVDRLREALGANTREVDLRSTIRLVSAPHRRGGERGPAEISQLPMPVRRQPRAIGEVTTRQPSAYGTPADSSRLTASQRANARMVPAGPDRSYTEFMIARRLKAEGASADAVYNALIDPELRPDIGHTAERSYAWFCKYMWSRIVVTERDPKKPGHSRRGHDWATFALPASRAVRAVWGQWSTRHRHTVEHVAVVAAARLGGLGAEGGPLPLRDLVEDTGKDLKTVQGALASLREAGILERVKRFKISSDVSASSDHYALTVELPNAASLTPTPRSYNPSDPLWLGMASSALSLTLTTLHEPTTAYDLTTLLRLSGFQFQRRPSTRQKSLALTVLTTLCSRAVLHQDSAGSYTNPTNSSVIRPRAGLRRWNALRERHMIERQRFRATIKELYASAKSAKARWNRERRECLEKLKIRRRRHQREWWDGLSEVERDHRRRIWKEMWHGSSVEAQDARLKKLSRERPKTTDWMLAA